MAETKPESLNGLDVIKYTAYVIGAGMGVAPVSCLAALGTKAFQDVGPRTGIVPDVRSPTVDYIRVGAIACTALDGLLGLLTPHATPTGIASNLLHASADAGLILAMYSDLNQYKALAEPFKASWNGVQKGWNKVTTYIKDQYNDKSGA